jgi:hypothetical protein
MCKQDAEYFRRLRRALGVPERDPFSASKFVKRGFELQRLEQLSWPKNMFGDYASISELMAEAVELSGQGADNTDSVSPCGCQREHNHSLSQTIHNPYGRGFGAVYFWSNACKSKWNRERMGRRSTSWFGASPKSLPSALRIFGQRPERRSISSG